jgi:hypothetical protein
MVCLPGRDGLFTECDGLFTECDGLFTECDGLFTECDGLFTECAGLFTECAGLFTWTEKEVLCWPCCIVSVPDAGRSSPTL